MAYFCIMIFDFWISKLQTNLKHDSKFWKPLLSLSVRYKYFDNSEHKSVILLVVFYHKQPVLDLKLRCQFSVDKVYRLRSKNIRIRQISIIESPSICRWMVDGCKWNDRKRVIWVSIAGIKEGNKNCNVDKYGWKVKCC